MPLAPFNQHKQHKHTAHINISHTNQIFRQSIANIDIHVKPVDGDVCQNGSTDAAAVVCGCRWHLQYVLGLWPS